jgi:hypothetical protein
VACRTRVLPSGGKHLGLRDDPESETGPLPRLCHGPFFEANGRRLVEVKNPEAGAQQHRHDVDVELVDQSGPRHLLNDARPADDLNRLVPGGGLRPGSRVREVPAQEGKRQTLILLRRGARLCASGRPSASDPWPVGSR